MKKRNRGLRLLAGSVIVACLGGTYCALKIYNEQAEENEAEEASGETILQVGEDSLTAISFLIGGETVSFTKQDDDTWQLDGDETFPVDSSVLLTPLAQLEPLKSLRTLTEAEDMEEYGLEEPQNVITLTEEDGSQTVLTIGDNNSVTGNDYLMMNDDDTKIYTIDTALREAFSSDLYDYAVSEELPALQASTITGLRVTMQEESYELYLEDAVWMVRESDAAEGEKADSDLVNTNMSSLSDLAYVDYLEHDCGDLSKYGLDEPAATVTITYEAEVETEAEESAGTEAPEDSTGTDTAAAEESAGTEASEDSTGTDTAAAEESAGMAAPEDSTDTAAEESAGTDTEASENGDAADGEAGETETAAVQTEERTVSFRIGDTDENGDYYVQMVGSGQVHTFSASVWEEFLSADADTWLDTEDETEAESGGETQAESGGETQAESGGETEA